MQAKKYLIFKKKKKKVSPFSSISFSKILHNFHKLSYFPSALTPYNAIILSCFFKPEKEKLLLII